MISGDGIELRNSPIPKPRSSLKPLVLDEPSDIISEADGIDYSGKKKKRSNLSRLKEKRLNPSVTPKTSAGDSATIAEDDTQNLQSVVIEDLPESMIGKNDIDKQIAEDTVEEMPLEKEPSPNDSQSIFEIDQTHIDEMDSPLTSRKKKKHKGALSRLKEKQANQQNSSLSSLRSAEMPDLRKIEDDSVQFTVRAPVPLDAADSKFDSVVKGSMPNNELPDKDDKPLTIKASNQLQSQMGMLQKPKLPSENTSFKPVNSAERPLCKLNMDDYIETDEEEEDNQEIVKNYSKLISSPESVGKPAFPMPKPSANIFNRSTSVKSNQMMKCDSMPNINDSVRSSVRSSKRNWELIRSKIGLEGAESLGENSMRRSASALSITSTASSGLQSVRMSTARHKNFLVGQKHTHSSVMGASELDRIFPDRNIDIFVGTWNMAVLKSLDQSIEDFLLPSNIEFVPDVLVITSQENEVDKKQWEVTLQETVGPTHVMYHSAQHGTLHMAVLMKRELIWFCSIAEYDTVTVRAFKQFKTKGAVAISFTMFGTSFLFIGSHFTSGEGDGKSRIQDYLTINKSLKLPRAVVDNPLQETPPLASLRFDSVFWAGDLNFRITKDRAWVLKMIKSAQECEHPDFEQLLEHEELIQAMNDGEIFEDFQEGQIGFPPSYKFDLGTDIYDTSLKSRIPSYTDRILFRSKRKHGIVCKKYFSASKVMCSDHKPVYGLYQVNLKPGRDTIPLSGGQFKRDVYVEAAKRRALRRVVVNIKPNFQTSAKSAICSIS